MLKLYFTSLMSVFVFVVGDRPLCCRSRLLGRGVLDYCLLSNVVLHANFCASDLGGVLKYRLMSFRRCSYREFLSPRAGRYFHLLLNVIPALLLAQNLQASVLNDIFVCQLASWQSIDLLGSGRASL